MTIALWTYVGFFLVMAITDFVWLRIPNILVGALLLLFPIAVLQSPREISWVAHVVPALVLFLFSLVPFLFNKFGAADVKLLTVAGLWVGYDAMPQFLVALGVGGFAIFMVYQFARPTLEWATIRAQNMFGGTGALPASIQNRKHLPYGVVIATAAIVVANRLPFFN
jgi:Flp pilus assembly protein protease CpaA